jgi:catechol 2,3-dioxygenase-like lactoylglutathione lyase family enzyme
VTERPAGLRRCWRPRRGVGQAVIVPIERIEHVQLAMPAGGEDAAVAFYEGLLGIRHVAKPDHLAVRGGCWFEDGNVKVHLGVDSEFRPARKAHPALLVTDLPELIEVLRRAGIAVHDDEPLAGYDRVYVDDPFGNRLELMEPAPRSARSPT